MTARRSCLLCSAGESPLGLAEAAADISCAPSDVPDNLACPLLSRIGADAVRAASGVPGSRTPTSEASHASHMRDNAERLRSSAPDHHEAVSNAILILGDSLI